MIFIRGNRWIEREKDNFKNGGEVKRLNECAQALNWEIGNVRNGNG